MDLVRELKDVRFELSLRGYDCEAVDAFLAKLRGDITVVQERNDAATGRISELEAAVQDGGSASSETEGTLRRTLVLAQRLADETEAEAKKIAAEMREAALADVAEMRSSAENESRSMREEGKRELDDARDEAAGIRETVSEEAARLRAETRVESERILVEAESRGMERVGELERTAQVEVATMREPIRAEVAELETARARVMEDISGLETHLEQQRVRVRTAVEALRVGMSGSIEDLERVADDDELLAIQPVSGTSGVRADDVAIAPDIEIVDRVVEGSQDAPSADDVEDAVRAPGAEVVDQIVGHTDDTVDEAVDQGNHEMAVEDEAAEDTASEDTEVEYPAVEYPAIDADAADVVVDEVAAQGEVRADDQGPATEPIPVINDANDATDVAEVVVDDEEQTVVELGEEHSSLFGTDVSSDAEVVAVDEEPLDVVDEVKNGPSQSGPSFVERFAELLDTHPVGREQ